MVEKDETFNETIDNVNSGPTNKYEEKVDKVIEKVEEYTKVAEEKFDELIKSETVKDIKVKTHEIVDDAKEKIEDVISGETAEKLKEKSLEYVNKTEEVLEDVSEKINKYSEIAEQKIESLIDEAPDEVKNAVNKGKSIFKRLFGK
ncbi:MAG: hypothetical protein KGV59_01630 [Tenacibaculum sp.]|nr:hypothetical protein [Tenacibaculum sp.]